LSESTANERILMDAPSSPPSKLVQVFFIPEERYTQISLLRCEGYCWIGLKPWFTLGLCLGTLPTQVCMLMFLPFHIWMLLKLVSGSHVWISPSIWITCFLTGFASSMCSRYDL